MYLIFKLVFFKGKRVVNEDGQEKVNDMFHENRLLQSENGTLRTRLKAMQETINTLTLRNTDLQAQKAASAWTNCGSDSDVTHMVRNYLIEIEELRAKLCESENMCIQVRRAAATAAAAAHSSGKSPHKAHGSPLKFNSSVSVLIEEAKRNLEKVTILILIQT